MFPPEGFHMNRVNDTPQTLFVFLWTDHNHLGWRTAQDLATVNPLRVGWGGGSYKCRSLRVTARVYVPKTISGRRQLTLTLRWKHTLVDKSITVMTHTPTLWGQEVHLKAVFPMFAIKEEKGREDETDTRASLPLSNTHDLYFVFICLFLLPFICILILFIAIFAYFYRPLNATYKMF